LPFSALQRCLDKRSELDFKKIAAEFKVLIHPKTIMAPQTPSSLGIL